MSKDDILTLIKVLEFEINQCLKEGGIEAESRAKTLARKIEALKEELELRREAELLEARIFGGD